MGKSKQYGFQAMTLCMNQATVIYAHTVYSVYSLKQLFYGLGMFVNHASQSFEQKYGRYLYRIFISRLVVSHLNIKDHTLK